MIALLKSLKYKYTTKDDLVSGQFRLVESTVSISEELTSFSTDRFLEVETYELFLNNKDFTVAKMKKILTEARKQTEVVSTELTYTDDEKGYLVTIIFNKES